MASRRPVSRRDFAKLSASAVKAPHVSPPGALCAAGLRMSQSTTKLPLPSCQLRLALLMMRLAGLFCVYGASLVAGAR